MPYDLSAAAKREKNKLTNDLPWILLLEVQVNAEITLYLAKHNEKITWNGNEYIAFPIEFGDKPYDMKSLPTFDVKVSNADQVIQSYIEGYHGLRDIPIIFRLVHAAHLDLTTPEMEEKFNIIKTSYTDQWVTFKMGAEFYLYYRALAERYLRDYCPHKYGKIKCGVPAATVAAYPSCNHTVKDCLVRMNHSGITNIRFRGCPGMGGMFASNSSS